MKSPKQFPDAYKKAAYEKDLRAFAELYDDDIQIFDTWGPWQMKGIQTWKEMAEGWFQSLGEDRVVIDFQDLEIQEFSDSALMTSIVRYAGVDSHGKELRWLNNRMTVVLRRLGNQWKVVHEHTSAPINHADLKAILRRT